jgi:hypothetical protein
MRFVSMVKIVSKDKKYPRLFLYLIRIRLKYGYDSRFINTEKLPLIIIR